MSSTSDSALVRILLTFHFFWKPLNNSSFSSLSTRYAQSSKTPTKVLSTPFFSHGMENFFSAGVWQQIYLLRRTDGNELQPTTNVSVSGTLWTTNVCRIFTATNGVRWRPWPGFTRRTRKALGFLWRLEEVVWLYVPCQLTNECVNAGLQYPKFC